MNRSETRALLWDVLARRLSGTHGRAAEAALRELELRNPAYALELHVAYVQKDRDAVDWQTEGAAIDALAEILESRHVGRRGFTRHHSRSESQLARESR